MSSESQNKKTAEEGKNVKGKKENTANKKPPSQEAKSKTKDRSDVNADVDQE